MHPSLRRPLKFALIVCAVPFLLVFVLVPILALAFDLGGAVRKQLVAMTPQVEKQIGRKLRFGDVKLKLLPGIAAEIRDVAIEAAPGETGIAGTPLVQLGAARLGIALWPLLTSFGQEIQISDLSAQGLRVTVVRFPDGRLSYQDVLDHLAQEPQEPKKPLTPEEIRYLHRLSVARVALLSTGLHFYDLSDPSGASIAIDQLDLVATNVRLSAPFPITLDGAMLSSQRNLHLGLSVGPFPDDLVVTQPLSLLRRLELSVKPVLLGPVLRFLPEQGVSLDNALFSTDLAITLPAEAGQLHIKGAADLKGLVLGQGVGQARQLGTPADLGLRADVMFSPLAGDLLAQTLEVSLSDMGVSGTADVRDMWRNPAVHALSLRSRGLLLERLLAILPASALPRDAVLRGPLALHAAGSGSPTQAQVEMGLDLTEATVLLPQLHKPAQTALKAEFSGKLNGGGMDIERLGLVLGPLSLLMHGKSKGQDDLDLLLDSGRVQLDQMLRLLPTVQKSVPRGGSLAGMLQVKGEMKKHGEALSASAQIAMSEADARVPGLEVIGNAGLEAQVRSTPTSASITANLDLTGARLYVPGSLDKAQGVPMHFKLDLGRTGKMIVVKEADLQLPGGLVQLRGQADLSGHKLDMSIPLCDLDLSRLAQVLPALHRGSALVGAHVRFALAVDGDPQQLSTVRARLTTLNLNAAGGHLQGSAEVVGLDAPRKLNFDFSGEGLDLDQLSGGSSGEQQPEGKKSGGAAALPAYLRHLDMEGKLHLASGRFKGKPLRDLTFETSMHNGKLQVKTLSVQALGGSVSAGGSGLDVSGPRPRFSLHTRMDRIDMEEVMSLRKVDSEQRLQGRGNASLDVEGTGLGWEEMAPGLAGQLALSLTEGRMRGASLEATVVNPLLAGLQALGKKNIKPVDMALKDLSVHFAIRNGQLSTTTPLKVNTEEGSLTLTGNIGLDQHLLLQGNLEIAPKTLEVASAGRLSPSGPVPVGLRISGTMKAPRIEVLDLGRTIAALAGALLQQRGKELLGHLGGPAGQGLGGAVDKLGQQGALKQEAEKRLQEEAQKRLNPPPELRDKLKGLFGN